MLRSMTACWYCSISRICQGSDSPGKDTLRSPLQILARRFPVYDSIGLTSLSPPVFFLLTVPMRYFCCGSLLLLVLAVRIYTLVQLLC